MAVKTLDELLASLSGDQRKLFENTLSQNPELKAGWLRQDEFSQKLNEFKSKETEFEKAKTRAEELEAWAERNVPVYNKLVDAGIVDDDGNELWTQQKTTLETELEEARKAAVAGAEMKPEELDARVKEIVKAAGGVTKEEYQALLQSEAKKIAEDTFKEEWKAKETDFNTKTIPFVAGFSAAAGIVAMHFEKETGESWTPDRQKEMYDLMSKENNFDPFKVEEKILAPYREKKAREKEIEERAAVKARELAKTMRAENGGSGDEFDIPQSESSKGALRQMLERSSGEDDFQALIAKQAGEAAKALRQEGKV
jgi:hypothetical protein